MAMPAKAVFPDPRKLPASEGLVAVGGDLSVEALVGAYSRGIFPWPSPGLPMLWHCPDPRGVLDFVELRVPRSLKAARRRLRCTFSMDQAFPRVIRACAAAERPGQDGTWIIPEMIRAYDRLHRAGFAHSVECWKGEELAAGIYGVYVRGVFSAESMFFKETNASKLCLLELASALRSAGLSWMDIQMLTPVTELLGGKYIPRAHFLDRLDASHRRTFPLSLSL